MNNTNAAIWSIWHPSVGLLCTFQPTRAEAIAEFCSMVDQDSYNEAVAKAQEGTVWLWPSRLTDTQRRAWKRFRAQGYMAVRVEAVVRDRRVGGAPDATNAGKE